MAELSTLARPYARAAFDHVQAQPQAVAWWSTMIKMASQIVQDTEVARVLQQPGRLPQQQTDLLMQALATQREAAPDFHNFISLLSENGRLPLLPAVAAEFERLKATLGNQMAVTIESAYPLSASQELLLVSRLEKRFGAQVSPTVVVKPELLSGVVIRAGDQVIDDSGLGRLQKLKNHLLAS